MNEKPTILIVDDDTAGRESIYGVLLSQGYDLLQAENGLEAIALAQENIPDLILLDVMMPGMDGFEVCQRLRSDPVTGWASRITTEAVTRCTTLSAADTQTATSSGEASVWPSTVAAGFHQMSRPESTAPAAMATPRMEPALLSWRSTSAPGRVSCTASTNHASSGPESRARKAPMRAPAATKAQKLCATA